MIPTSVGLTVTDNTVAQLDATNDKAAVVCIAPKTGNVTKLRFYVYDGNWGGGSSIYDARCETVTSGAPTGTLKTAGANGTATVSSAGVKEVAFGTAASVTAGDYIAGVLNATTVSGTRYMRPVVGFPDDAGIRGTTFGTYNIDGGGWTNVEHAGISLVYDDGTVIGAQAGTIVGGIVQYNVRSDTTPDEFANWFTTEAGINVVGAVVSAMGTGFGDSTNDFDVVLYNGAGTAQQTVNVNNANMPSSSAGIRYVKFAPFAVAAAGTFGISVIGKQSTHGSINLTTFTFAAAADRTNAFGWTAYMRSRADAGAWTDYNPNSADYAYAMITPIVEITAPAASGGLLMPNLRGNFA